GERVTTGPAPGGGRPDAESRKGSCGRRVRLRWVAGAVSAADVNVRDTFVEQQLIDGRAARGAEVIILPRVAHVGIGEGITEGQHSAAHLSQAPYPQRFRYRPKWEHRVASHVIAHGRSTTSDHQEADAEASG